MGVNEGGFDRLLRLVIGFALASMVLWGAVAGVARWVVLAVAVIAVATAVVGYCPLYHVLGLKTRRAGPA